MPSASVKTIQCSPKHVWTLPGSTWSFRLITFDAMVLVSTSYKEAWWQWEIIFQAGQWCVCILASHSSVMGPHSARGASLKRQVKARGTGVVLRLTMQRVGPVRLKVSHYRLLPLMSELAGLVVWLPGRLLLWNTNRKCSALLYWWS